MSTDDWARKWQELNKATDGWHLSFQLGLCLLIDGDCQFNSQTLCDNSNNTSVMLTEHFLNAQHSMKSLKRITLLHTSFTDGKPELQRWKVLCINHRGGRQSSPGLVFPTALSCLILAYHTDLKCMWLYINYSRLRTQTGYGRKTHTCRWLRAIGETAGFPTVSGLTGASM